MLSNVSTYHIHDLHEAEAEFDGERLRVVGDRSHQRVVAHHQVLVQSALVWPLKRNYRRQRNLDSKSFHNPFRRNVSTTDTVVCVTNFFFTQDQKRHMRAGRRHRTEPFLIDYSLRVSHVAFISEHWPCLL